MQEVNKPNQTDRDAAHYDTQFSIITADKEVNKSTVSRIISENNNGLSNKKLRIDRGSKDDKKELSFFPDADCASSNDSTTPPLVTEALSTSKLDVDDKIFSSINRDRQKLLARMNSNDEDASSTDSCSCEDHSSVGEKSDNDPHGDLDYDEDSITDSPSNENPGSNSVDDASANNNLSPLENSKNQDDLVQTKDKGSDIEPIQDEDVKKTDSSVQSVKLENGNKLRSFININNATDEDGDEETHQKRKVKDGTHKNYHGLLKQFFKDACYFQIKSINHENVGISKSMGVWSTPTQNETRLNAAFRAHRNVILIFSVQQSGAFQGFARMTSESRPASHPIPWVLPERLSRANLGGVIRVEWLCTRELSFNETRDLHNPLNQNKPIKIARDGQQVESKVGKQLCSLFPRDSKKRLLASLESLKLHTRRARFGNHSGGQSKATDDIRHNLNSETTMPHARMYPQPFNGGRYNMLESTKVDNYGPSYDFNMQKPYSSRNGFPNRRRAVINHPRVDMGSYSRHLPHMSVPRPNGYYYNEMALGTPHYQADMHTHLPAHIDRMPYMNGQIDDYEMHRHGYPASQPPDHMPSYANGQYYPENVHLPTNVPFRNPYQRSFRRP